MVREICRSTQTAQGKKVFFGTPKDESCDWQSDPSEEKIKKAKLA